MEEKIILLWSIFESDVSIDDTSVVNYIFAKRQFIIVWHLPPPKKNNNNITQIY